MGDAGAMTGSIDAMAVDGDARGKPASRVRLHRHSPTGGGNNEPVFDGGASVPSRGVRSSATTGSQINGRPSGQDGYRSGRERRCRQRPGSLLGRPRLGAPSQSSGTGKRPATAHLWSDHGQQEDELRLPQLDAPLSHLRPVPKSRPFSDTAIWRGIAEKVLAIRLGEGSISPRCAIHTMHSLWEQLALAQRRVRTTIRELSSDTGVEWLLAWRWWHAVKRRGSRPMSVDIVPWCAELMEARGGSWRNFGRRLPNSNSAGMPARFVSGVGITITEKPSW